MIWSLEPNVIFCLIWIAAVAGDETTGGKAEEHDSQDDSDGKEIGNYKQGFFLYYPHILLLL